MVPHEHVAKRTLDERRPIGSSDPRARWYGMRQGQGPCSRMEEDVDVDMDWYESAEGWRCSMRCVTRLGSKARETIQRGRASYRYHVCIRELEASTSPVYAARGARAHGCEQRAIAVLRCRGARACVNCVCGGARGGEQGGVYKRLDQMCPARVAGARAWARGGVWRVAVLSAALAVARETERESGYRGSISRRIVYRPRARVWPQSAQLCVSVCCARTAQKK